MKFTEVESPAIAGVVRECTVKNAIKAIKAFEKKGATVIDLHLSTLEDEFRNVESIKKIVQSTKLPILALNYSQRYDYTEIPGITEEERVDLLRVAAKAGVAAIDVQGYTFDYLSKNEFHGDKTVSFYKEGIKELVTDKEVIDKQIALFDEFHKLGCEVLSSNHPGIVMSASQVVELAKFVAQRKPDIIKIVTRAETPEDNAEALKALLQMKKELNCKVSYHLAGKEGHISRIMNPMMGGFMMFCVNGTGVNNLPEQLDVDTAVAAVKNIKKIL